MCRFVLSPVCLAVVLLSVAAPPAAAQTVDEIVNQHVAARGGIEKWKALQTFAILARSDSFSFDQRWKAPNRIRADVYVQIPSPLVDVRAFDGTTAWRIAPMEGSEQPRPMSAEELSGLLEETAMFRELIDYKARGYKVELVGKDSVDGNPAFKLALTKPSGLVHVFLDARTFLEVKRVTRGRTPWGEDMEFVTTLGDYRSVGGLMLPHRIGSGSAREYRVNEPIDDSVFAMPRTK